MSCGQTTSLPFEHTWFVYTKAYDYSSTTILALKKIEKKNDKFSRREEKMDKKGRNQLEGTMQEQGI